MQFFAIIIAATVVTVIIKVVFSVEAAARRIPRCDIHKWTRQNNILFCSRCGFAPEIEQKIKDLSDEKKSG